MSRIEMLGDAERLQLLVDGVVDYAVYLIGADGRVVTWNSGARRLKGYEPSEPSSGNFVGGSNHLGNDLMHVFRLCPMIDEAGTQREMTVDRGVREIHAST